MYRPCNIVGAFLGVEPCNESEIIVPYCSRIPRIAFSKLTQYNLMDDPVRVISYQSSS
jgi:hypothetical protein